MRYWWLLGTPSGLWLSPKRIVFLILATFVLMIFAIHVYFVLRADFILNNNENTSNQNYSSYLSELSNFLSLNEYDRTAAQINNQLSQIERNLKENRLILQQIRSNINSAHFNISEVDDQLNNEYFSQEYLSNYFYNLAINNSALCRWFDDSVDIKMEQIYDQIPFDNPDGGVWKQGWNLEPSPEDLQTKLNVFVVPHSHNDPGWIKTFDDYFRQQTKPILTNTVEQLNAYPDMKMIWAEVSYLSAWWQTISSEDHKKSLRNLIDSGRLEIVSGGWVMNDEANTHYYSILTQLVEGHEWLQDNLGVAPKYGWAIDPFGLSPIMAYMYKEMGLKAIVIQRVHYAIKKRLAKQKQLEFNWRQHWETSQSNEILAHIEPFYSYDIPHTCGPDPKVCCQFDFKRLPPSRVKCPWKISPVAINEDNVEQRLEILIYFHHFT